MKITAVVFDFNGIFAEPIEFRIVDSICRNLRFGKIMALSNYFINIFRFEKGKLSPQEFWQRVFPCLEPQQYSAWVEAEYEKPARHNNEMYALAERLAKKFPLYCLSNSNFLQGKACRKQKLYAPFKALFLSHETGRAKPFPSAFRNLLEATGLKAGECLFIDDSLRNAVVARLLGFRAIKFSGPTNLEQRLKKLGVI
ncbi:Uncharacterised protein [uncultured archaeon]|nr:Uncharacterised protein [uncultured archaeon]